MNSVIKEEYAPGLPPITVDFETKEYNDAIELAQSFLDAKANATSALQIFKSFSVNLKGLFISHLIDNQEIVDDCMAQYIYDTLQLGDEINGEVVFRWLIVAIRSGQLRAPFESADEFVGSIGRMKLIIIFIYDLN